MPGRASSYYAHVAIHSRYPLIGARLQQLASDVFLDRQDDAIFAPDADRRAAVLDRFHRVLDLEVAAVGGEDGVGEVVAGADGRLRGEQSAGRTGENEHEGAGEARTDHGGVVEER